MAWKKMRCNRTLVDHFLREGHYTSAMLLAQSCDIEVIDGSVDRFCAYNLYHSVHVPLYGIFSSFFVLPSLSLSFLSILWM